MRTQSVVSIITVAAVTACLLGAVPAAAASRIVRDGGAAAPPVSARGGAPTASGEEVRANILRLLEVVGRTHPESAELQNRIERARTRFESLTGEQANQLARLVEADTLAGAVRNLEQRETELAAGAPRRATTQSLVVKPLIVGPASHPLLNQDPSSGEIYDTVCGNSFSDAQTDKNMVIAIDSLTIAAIVGDVACNAIVVVFGEGTNLPACIIAGVLHEAVEGTQFALDLNNFCDGDVSGNENHATFENIYHLHNDLINSVANDDQNTANIISDVDSKAGAVINNANANLASIITNANTNASNIINNDNANTTNIINNANANLATTINEIRVVGCELDRLLNTPEGQRASSIASCSAQPGFPYKFTGATAKGLGATSTVETGAAAAKAVWSGRGQDGLPILPMMGTVTMETNLLAGRLIPSYYLPASHGGMIEQVKALVWSTIDGQAELAIAVAETADAKLIAQDADELLDQQRYVEAYRRYALAYQRLVPADGVPGKPAIQVKTQ